jgi:hypothetical protein
LALKNGHFQAFWGISEQFWPFYNAWKQLGKVKTAVIAVFCWRSIGLPTNATANQKLLY